MVDDRREIEFLRTLGIGGFGAVYLANLHGRERFVRRVAVKVMREGLDATPDLVARQKDEARLLGLLAHENIVQVIDLAEVQGRPAVVMEYVEGVDLSEVLKSAPQRMSARAALEVVVAVASALDAAYNSVSAVTGNPLRVIHRDIKPANMLLTASGRVKVLDFGVAKADFARDGHTTNGGWGTPRFMAPEQWLGEAYGAAIDTYALGVTLFDLVADRPWERPPLSRTPYESNVAAQLDGQPEVPENVLALIASMLAFDAADRPSSAEVREYAEQLLADAPGEPLARYARALVPSMVESKALAVANQPVPGPITLGSSRSATQGPPSLAPAVERSVEPSRQTVGAGVLTALALGVAALLLITLGGAAAAWSVWGGFSEPSSEPLAAAEVPPPAPEPLATAENPPAPLEPPLPAAVEPEAAAPTPASPPRSRASSAPASPARIAPPPSTTAPTAAAPAAAAVEPPVAAPVARAPLSITSVPTSAEVWIDGHKVGETPLRDHALTAGAHTVWVRLEGVDSPRKSITVSAGAPLALRYDYQDKTWRTVK